MGRFASGMRMAAAMLGMAWGAVVHAQVNAVAAFPGPAVVEVGEALTVNVGIDNVGATPAAGINATVNFANVEYVSVATLPACAGGVTLISPSQIVLTGLSAPPAGQCIVQVNLVATAAGNGTATVPAGGGVSTTATAALIVSAAPATQVTSAAFVGPNTLKSAIAFVNSHCSGSDVITFNITGGGPHTILPSGGFQFPPLTCNGTTIDGYTQPGSAPNGDSGPTNTANIQIILNGVSCASTCNGLTIQASGVTVRGLAIRSFPDFGVYIAGGASGVAIEGNYIGTDPGGATGYPNASGGVHAGAPSTIGGGAPGQRNLITGNPEGVLVFSSGVTVQGNQIGGTRGGGLGLGNAGTGVHVYSGQADIVNNFIVSNGLHGLWLESNSNQANGNVITSNSGAGALLSSGGSHWLDVNTIAGNLQGGVEIDSSYNLVSGNTVNGNAAFGVRVFSGTENQIYQTRSFGNGGHGIVHGTGTGGAPNDEAAPPYDTDTGPNELMNHPVITAAYPSGGDTVVEGTVKSAPGGMPVQLDFFSNPAMPGHREGQTFVATHSLFLDANGLGTFNFTLPGAHNYITATSTVDVCGDGCNVTSEFSPPVVVGAPPAAMGTIAPTALSFGPTVAGSTSAPQQVMLTNSGTVDFAVTSINVTGPFQYTAGSTCMIGSPISGGGSCMIEIVHAPLVPGGAVGQLSVAIDSGTTFTVSLNGAAVAAPVAVLSANPESMDFGSVLPGAASEGKTLTIKNVGGATAFLTGIQVTGAFEATLAPSGPFEGDPPPSGKSIAKALEAVGVVCPAGPFSLPPNASCTTNVRFLPPAQGTYVGEIQLNSNAPYLAVPLKGTSGALKTIAIEPGMISFGDVVFGRTSGERSFTITNTGTEKITIASVQLAPADANSAGQVADFILTHNCTSLEPAGAAPGAAASSCSGVVKFKPTALGARAAALAVAGDFEGGSKQVPLTGTGIASPTPLLVFPATNFGFGQTTLGVTQSQSFTITNGGQLPVNVSGIYTMGDFVVRHDCPEQLGAGASCSITTSFVPMIPGQREGFLVIVSNAEGSPHRFPLEGKACRGFSPRTARLGLVTCAQ